MIRITVLYPNTHGSRFDMDYYLKKHCPMVLERVGASCKGFGVDHFTSGISAAGAILYYLEFTEHRETGHIASIARIDQDDYVWVDKFTIRNLELFSSNGAREKCSFADVIDRQLYAGKR